MKYTVIKTILVLIILLPFTAWAGNNGDKKQLRTDSTEQNSVIQRKTSAGCSAYADCVDGSKATCSTTNSGVSCEARDQYCRRWGGSSGGWATCGNEESHCNPNLCPPPPKTKCEKYYEGKWCKNSSGCGGIGACHNNVCICP